MTASADWSAFARVFGTLFAVASPIGAIPFFLGYTAGQTRLMRRRTAATACAAMVIALAIIILFGTGFLGLFGITEDGFKIGGGFVILLSGIKLVRARVESMAISLEQSESTEESALSAISPFAIPLVIGPGAFSAVILGLHANPGLAGYLVVSAACALLMVLMYAALLLSDTIAGFLRSLGMDITVRLMGLVIIIIAFETMISGLKALLPGLALS